jgi:NADPH:quinone reductase-like Zn-dependent oxidoreductase
MTAVVWTAYGPPDLLRIRDVDAPSPAPGQLLIRVRAASINPIDWHFMRGSPFPVRLMTGLRTPGRKLGHDVAGVVEAAGANAAQFKPGDEVFGTCSGGSLAEYVCAPETAIAAKPANVTFEQAAAVPVAALTALQALRDKGRLQPGQRVLINGASGGVGTFAVQIAKVLGAHVTGVCSTKNVDMVRSLGAERVIDYTRDDFTRGGERYDLLIDNATNHSMAACRRVLAPNGRHVIVGGSGGFASIAGAVAASAMSRFRRRKVVLMVTRGDKEHLLTLRDLLAAGTIAPVIDRRYPLADAVEAIRYLETGHARGKVIVTP